MENKKKLENVVKGAGKTAKSLFNKAVLAADQNDDGKFDLSDVSAVAGAMGNAVKKGALSMKETVDDKSRQLELKTLNPVFPSTLDEVDFLMPKFIRVTDRDKKHAESVVCQGSVGYLSEPKGQQLLNVFRDSIDAFGIALVPDDNYEFYYVDPTERNRYIALDEYFSYLKIARVNELQKIAQDLGAKHFRVTFKEEQTSFSEKKLNAKTAAGSVDHHSVAKKYSKVEIEAEMNCPGHEPVKPQLKYMQRDPSIQGLVAMRMDASSPLLNQKFMLKMSASSGIKENDAVKIDTILKSMKLSGNATVSSEAKNETRRYLEYDITF